DQNLLDYYYLSASGQPQEVLWVTPVQVEARMRKQNDYYKAYWHKSRFSFVAESNCSVILSLTFRVPRAENGIGIDIEVNGVYSETITGSRRWETWQINVDGSLIHDGVNEITVHWSMLKADCSKVFENPIAALDDLADGPLPELFPVFG